MADEVLESLADVALKNADGDPDKALPAFLKVLELAGEQADPAERQRVMTVAHAYLCSRVRAAQGDE